LHRSLFAHDNSVT
jgi:U3 small nucleolar RNA-associated protein 12